MRWLARWARRMADIIDPTGRAVPLELSFRIDPGRGVVLYGEHGVYLVRDGAPLYYLGEEGVMAAQAEVTPEWARASRTTFAPVSPGRQPYCVVHDAEHAPPLHYYPL